MRQGTERARRGEGAGVRGGCWAGCGDTAGGGGGYSFSREQQEAPLKGFRQRSESWTGAGVAARG